MWRTRAGALTAFLLSIAASLLKVCQTVNASEEFSIKWLEWKTVLELSVDGAISSVPMHGFHKRQKKVEVTN